MEVFVVTCFDDDNSDVINVLCSFEKAIDFIEKNLKEIIVNQKIECGAEIVEDFEEWKASILKKYTPNDACYYHCDYWDIGYEIINFEVE